MSDEEWFQIEEAGSYVMWPDDPSVYWYDGRHTVDLSWDEELCERLRRYRPKPKV